MEPSQLLTPQRRTHSRSSAFSLVRLLGPERLMRLTLSSAMASACWRPADPSLARWMAAGCTLGCVCEQRRQAAL